VSHRSKEGSCSLAGRRSRAYGRQASDVTRFVSLSRLTRSQTLNTPRKHDRRQRTTSRDLSQAPTRSNMYLRYSGYSQAKAPHNHLHSPTMATVRNIGTLRKFRRPTSLNRSQCISMVVGKKGAREQTLKLENANQSETLQRKHKTRFCIGSYEGSWRTAHTWAAH
jgi:hypothetical protein